MFKLPISVIELVFDIFCMSLFFHYTIASEVILVPVQFILWQWVKTYYNV